MEVVHKLANNILKPANNIINFSKIALSLSEFLMTFKIFDLQLVVIKFDFHPVSICAMVRE